MSNEPNEMPGGWTEYRDLTSEDKAVFDEALQGFVGVNYTPNSVATQVVAGVNYRFKCTATLHRPNGDTKWEVIVEIYQPLEGTPHIISIARV